MCCIFPFIAEKLSSDNDYDDDACDDALCPKKYMKSSTYYITPNLFFYGCLLFSPFYLEVLKRKLLLVLFLFSEASPK